MMQLRIRDESELYNPLDPTQTRLNDKVYAYLKSYCTEIESKKHLHDTLQVISDTPIDGDRLKQAIQDAVRKDQEGFDRQMAINHNRALEGYAIGLILSIIGVALSLLMDQILLAIICFFGTTAVSDAFTIQRKINPDIKRLKKLLEPFCDFKLEVIQK